MTSSESTSRRGFSRDILSEVPQRTAKAPQSVCKTSSDSNVTSPYSVMTSQSLNEPVYASIKKVTKKDSCHSLSDVEIIEENDGCKSFMTSYKIKSHGSFSPDRLSEAQQAEEPRPVDLTSDESEYNMTSQKCDMTSLSLDDGFERLPLGYSPSLSTIHEVSEEDTSSSFVDVTLGNDVTIKHNDETASIKSKEYIIIDDDVISLNSDNAHLTFEE